MVRGVEGLQGVWVVWEVQGGWEIWEGQEVWEEMLGVLGFSVRWTKK